MVVDTNPFSVELYKKFATSPGNQLISPFSIFSTLFLLYIGARRETKRQIEQIFRNSSEMTERLEQYKVFLEDSHICDPDSGFDSSSCIWVQQDYTLNQDYLKSISHLDKGCLRVVDFSDGPNTSKTINNWANKTTRGKIEEIISEDQFSPDVPLIVTNASYFKCEWKQPFFVEETKTKPFRSFATPSDMEIKHVPMMNETDSFNYYEDEELQAVELLYSSENETKGPLPKELKPYLTFGGPNPKVYAFSMVILLPRKDSGIFELEKKLTPEYMSHCINNMTGSVTTAVSLPRFNMEGSYSLEKVLAAAGMPDMFDRSRANFSGIAEGRLFVSDLYQKNFIDVDETGTKAAAVTTGMLAMGTFKSIMKFNVDHPFLYFIRHISTGTILFLGRVVDPESNNCQ